MSVGSLTLFGSYSSNSYASAQALDPYVELTAFAFSTGTSSSLASLTGDTSVGAGTFSVEPSAAAAVLDGDDADGDAGDGLSLLHASASASAAMDPVISTFSRDMHFSQERSKSAGVCRDSVW